MSNKVYISWQDLDEAMEQLALIAEHNFDCIVGLSRGGLPIAVKLSNLTGIPMVPVVWQTRDGIINDKTTLMATDLGYSNILVVDDICDSGLTFNQVKEYLPTASYYAMVTKKIGDVDHAYRSMEGDNRWVVFPWEKQD